MQRHSTIPSCRAVARRGVFVLCFAMTLLPTMAWHHHTDVVQKRPLAMPWGQSPPQQQQQPAHCTSDAYLPTTTQPSSVTAAVSPHVPEDPIALSPRCTSNDAVESTTPISSTVQLTSSSTLSSMSNSMTSTKTMANIRGAPAFTKAARVVRKMFSPSVQHPYSHNEAAARTMECNNACDPTCYMADASFAGFGC